MNNSCITTYKSSLLFLWFALTLLLLNISVEGFALSIAGPVSASNVVVSGSVTLSSATVSSMTITDSLRLSGTGPSVTKSVYQIRFASTTQTTTTTSTGTFQAINELKVTLALSNATNYFRISVTGVLSFAVGERESVLTVKRDSVDLGAADGTGLAMAKVDLLFAFPEAWRPVGIVISDSPGDTSNHTYQVFIRTNGGGTIGAFPHAVGYLILEEITR